MGKINKFNHYPFQDLTLSRPIIEKMLADGRKIKGIFNFLRKEARWDAIGDFPLLAFVCSTTRNAGYTFSEQEVTRILKKTEEFKSIRQNSQLIQQICGSLISQNDTQQTKKKKTSNELVELGKQKI